MNILTIWEYNAERFPNAPLWPQSRQSKGIYNCKFTDARLLSPEPPRSHSCLPRKTGCRSRSSRVHSVNLTWQTAVWRRITAQDGCEPWDRVERAPRAPPVTPKA
jgi:hypothetical protein